MKVRGLVVVGDGRKALLLDRSGTKLQPQLRVREVVEAPDNPPTQSQGSDRPGRSFQSVGRMRSALSQTDFHEMAERRFAKQVVAVVEALVRSEDIKDLILVAPPKTLASLRRELPEGLRKLVSLEIDKELTKLPLEEIAEHIGAR